MKKRITFKDQRGQAVLTVVVFLLSIGMSIIYGVVSPTLKQSAVAENLIQAGQSYATSESGIEDVIYRLKKGMQVGTTEVLMVASSTATTTVTAIGSSEKTLISTGDSLGRIRTNSANLAVANGVSFNYGVQVGNGGFFIENSSKVVGNIYANGPVFGENSNLIKGDVVSAGYWGLIENVNATGTIYAHKIRNSSVGKDAYYQSIYNTTVGGVKHAGSVDQPSAALPISDTTISAWEQDALAGGTISYPCPYTITSNRTIGPVKITCDLVISGNPTVTLNGPVWVSGDIRIRNTPIIKVSSTLGTKSVAVIADNPNRRHHDDQHDSSNYGESQISIENSPTFQGSGSIGSYILLVSQNNDAESSWDNWWNDWYGNEWHSWWSAPAIDVANSAQGAVLLYAGHGEVLLEDNVSVKEVTAYRVHLKNSAQVTYETGLASLLFTSGPSGAWTVKGWKETQ